MSDIIKSHITELLSRRFLLERLLLGCGLLLLGSLITASLFTTYRDAENQERERLLMQARVIDANYSRHLDAVNHALVSLQGTWLQLKRQPGGFSHMNQQLSMLTDAMPSVRTLTLVDADGTVLASNQSALIGKNFRHRDYFSVPQKNPTYDTLYVAPPFRTVLGIYALTLSRVLHDGRGNFAGVIVATLDPDEIKVLLESVRYAEDMRVGINHGDGLVIMTVPPRSDLNGISLAKPGSFYSRHIASGKDENIFSGTMFSSGDQRIAALHTINPAPLHMNKPLMVAVSRDQAAIYGHWRDTALVQVGSYLLLVVCAFAALLLYQRHHRRASRQIEQITAQLADRERSLQTIIDTEPECVKVLSADGALLQMNRAGLDMIEADSEAQVLGAKVIDLVTPEYRAAFIALGNKVMQGEAGQLEFEIIGLKGGHRWLDTHAVPLRDAEGHITSQLAVTRDVTARKALEQKLHYLARTDTLSGLANRRHFMEEAERELSRSIRYGGELSVLLMDIDHFKIINDTYGHQAGDCVILRLAELCRETLRDIDLIGRIGGEEFAILLPQTGGTQAKEVAERLRQVMAANAVPDNQGQSVSFTVSLGVTSLAGSKDLDTLLWQADKALYEAKKSGRNRVCIYQS